MNDLNIDFSIPNVIEPGTQKSRADVLSKLCEYVGQEMNVPIETLDIVKAADSKTEPAFMFTLGPIEYKIYLIAHGLAFSREFDPGEWVIHPIEVGNQIRDAITSLQVEYDSHKFRLDL